jgi:methylmalonyl-CoA decarboxylase subunit alpha
VGSKETMKKFIDQHRIQQQSTNILDSLKSVKSKQRLQILLDEGSFVELNRYVKHRNTSDLFFREPIEGDGVITGYGTIGGRLVYVASEDSTVYGGSVGQMHAAKITESIYKAIQSNAPFIMLYDTAGVRIEEGIRALEGMAGILSAFSEASVQIPVIAGIMGHCPGGSAISAGMCHFRLFVESSSGLYMNGPMVTAAFEGVTLQPSDIGGAHIHDEKTGAASFVYPDELTCIESIRKLLEYFPGYQEEPPLQTNDDPNRIETALDTLASEMDQGYDLTEIIRLIADRDSTLEVSKNYEPGVLTALVKLDGVPVGVIGTREKRITNAMTKKIRSFIRTCRQIGLPLITVVDSQGFAIGLDQEKTDIVEQSGLLLYDLESYPYPKISLVIGEAIGTAYLILAAKQCGYDFLYAWPTAQIAVLKADTAANILYRDQIKESPNPLQARDDFIEGYEEEIASAKTAASYGHVDEIILPSCTRIRLISALQVL